MVLVILNSLFYYIFLLTYLTKNYDKKEKMSFVNKLLQSACFYLGLAHKGFKTVLKKTDISISIRMLILCSSNINNNIVTITAPLFLIGRQKITIGSFVVLFSEICNKIFWNRLLNKHIIIKYRHALMKISECWQY